MDRMTTESVRELAPRWSLAGDELLLKVLQDTHQKIISKCDLLNKNFMTMSSALEEASIDLQNVNNRFMALSNSQFIESRVYDDETDLATDTHTEQLPLPPQAANPPDELSTLRSSISVLERVHDTAEIVDDSGSDSDGEISIVLKPRDTYCHRPLPYVIGTQQWRNKWHAGLVVEESDSDSCTSKRDDSDVEQYSDSTDDEQTQPPPRTISETSSLQSDKYVVTDKHTSPDIVAEITDKLGETPHLPPRAEDYKPPVKTVYKTNIPVVGPIFREEPPPLDQYDSDDSLQGDIFHEINKNTPYTERSKVQDGLADDLFGFNKNEPYVQEDKGDIFSDFAPEKMPQKPIAKPSSFLFEDAEEPELFAPKPQVDETNTAANISKKPIGGISLFGSNKESQSIGAAILNRNRRKSTSSESGSDVNDDGEKTDGTDNKNKVFEQLFDKKIVDSKKIGDSNKKIVDSDSKIASGNKQDILKAKDKNNDIFDNLFAKDKAVTKEDKAKKPDVVKDLFSDNIFDDIDDIFTTNIKVDTNKQTKSLFNDNDDLFSDVAKPVTNKPTSSQTNLFDSDDDLFTDVNTIKSDKAVSNENKKTKDVVVSKKNEVKNKVNEKSIFDSDSDNDIFANSNKVTQKGQDIKKGSIFDDFDEVTQKNKETKDKITKTNQEIKQNSIFNDFNEIPKVKEVKRDEKTVKEAKLKIDNSKVFQSPSIFDDGDSDEGLFAEKPKINENLSKTVQPNDKEIGLKIDIETKVPKLNDLDDFTKDFDNLLVTNINTTEIRTEQAKLDSYNDVISPTIPIKSATDTKQSKIDSNVKAISPTITSQDLDDIIPDSQEDIEKSALNTRNESLISNTIDKASPNLAKQVINENETLLPAQKGSESYVEIQAEDIDKVKNYALLQEEKGSEFNVETPAEDTDIFKDKEIKEDLKISVSDDPKSADDIDIFNEKEIQTEIKENTEPKPIKHEDIFSTIFAEPPTFEKTDKNKTKNVNALFDDDSDDETMFFKKDVGISDEKPDVFTTGANFGIFHDEPPELDVDDHLFGSDVGNIAGDDVGNIPDDEFGIKDSSQGIKDKNFGSGDGIFEAKSNNNHDNISNVHENRGFDTKSENLDSDQKNITNLNKNDNLANVFVDSTPQRDIKNENLTKIDSVSVDNDIFKVPEADNLFGEVNKNTQNSKNKPISLFGDDDDDIFTQPSTSAKHKTELNKDEITKPLDKTDNNIEPKKIGRINSKININVNALLPGASPKKVKQNDETDYIKEITNVINTAETENIEAIKKNTKTLKETSKTIDNKKARENTIDIPKSASTNEISKAEPITVKSISFDKDLESEVLDNNLSKKRAKIQVKRRPSTRRARHEAARKSYLDLDSDNSSSLDEPRPKTKSNLDQKVANDADTLETTKLANDERKSEKETPKLANLENVDPKLDNTKSISNDKFKVENPKEVINEKQSNKDTVKKEQTTKIVYVLNDEDIFSTNPVKNTGISNENALFGSKNNDKKSIFDDISDDETDLFGNHKVGTNHKSQNNDHTTGNDNKLAKNDHKKTTNDHKLPKNVHKLPTNEEKSQKNDKIKKSETKKLFDSDSDDDLFANKSSIFKNDTAIRKTSLFGDDSEHLFETKTNRQEPTTSSKSFTKEKTPEPVFNDPLSLFGDD